MPKLHLDNDQQDGFELIPIPSEELSAEALRGVIEAFVLREGTDYGAQEVSLERKVADVRAQLGRGDALIVFDPNTESVDIVKESARRRR